MDKQEFTKKTAVEYCKDPRQRVKKQTADRQWIYRRVSDWTTDAHFGAPRMHTGRSQALSLEEVSHCTFIVPTCLKAAVIHQAGCQATQNLV